MTANVALTDSFDQWRVKTNEVVVMTQTDGMSNFIKVLDTTDSTSNTTGSIIAAGGLGVLKSAVIGENLRVHGNIHANGAISADGSITLGDADTDNIVFTADINSSIVPNSNNVFNIGNTTMFWANTWTGHLTTEQKTDSGKPALTINSLDADVDGVRITASQDTANAFHINAHSLTTGTGITVLADALTTGSALTIDSDAGVGTRNVVEIINDNALAVGATPFYVKNDSTNTVARFIGTSTIVIPAGTTAQRATAVQGGIRYNSTLSSFEGYSGSQWGSLGGVIDVDQDTKIIAETSAGADGDDLDFFTAGTQRMKIDQAGLITVGVDGTGYDVKFFGATATTGYMLWDEDTDDLILGPISKLGIGTTTPTTQVEMAATEPVLTMSSYSGGSAGTAGQLILQKSRHGTVGSHTTVQAEDYLGSINFKGSDGDSWGIGAHIRAVADQTWTDSALGAYLSFYTVDNSTTTLDERMRIDHNGNIGINQTAPASALHVTGTVQVGVDNIGHDVKFFGATASRFMHWDEDRDALRFPDNTKMEIGSLAAGDMQIWHDGTNSFIVNATGALKIATENSGIAVNIGHPTSMVTIGDNLTVTDTLTELSMREMKTNISNMENMLPAVLQMQGVQFVWKDDPAGRQHGINHYGFIAEDVEKVLPNLVSRDNKGKAQGIQYSKMTAVLLEAIKEQQIQIDELKSKILN